MRVLSFEQEFERSNPGRVQIIRYMRDAIGVREVEWEHITRLNLIAVTEHIRNIVSANSAVTYLAVLKGFLAKYKDEGIIPCRELGTSLKTKREPQQNVALTEDEVRKIEGYHNKLRFRNGHQTEKDVLTLFLLECFCGARSCDIEALGPENIQDGKLVYVSQKTHVLTALPAHRRLADLLNIKPEKQYFTTTKNRIIKRVAEKCSINEPVTIFYHGQMQTRPKYEYLGTHSARRTFASVLAAKGVPVAEISNFMGHTNTAMTERYIKVDSKCVSPAAMAFFGGE